MHRCLFKESCKEWIDNISCSVLICYKIICFAVIVCQSSCCYPSKRQYVTLNFIILHICKFIMCQGDSWYMSKWQLLFVKVTVVICHSDICYLSKWQLLYVKLTVLPTEQLVPVKNSYNLWNRYRNWKTSLIFRLHFELFKF